jgi:membrane associated rhomboid family serine protease
MDDGRTSFGFARPTPVVLWTIGALVVSFVGFAIAMRVSDLARELYSALALQPDLVVGPPWRVWTLVTYGLLHGLDNIWHLVFNCLVLYWFGPGQERAWGARAFVAFMVAAAFVGGLFVVAAYAIGLSRSPVVGISAVTAGLTLAWGLANKDAQVFFFFFRMKGIQLVYIMIGIEILQAVSFSPISAAAHFGGMAVGGLVSWGPARRWWLQRRLGRLQREAASLRSQKPRSSAAASGFRVIEGGGGDGRGGPKDKRYLN